MSCLIRFQKTLARKFAVHEVTQALSGFTAIKDCTIAFLVMAQVDPKFACYYFNQTIGVPLYNDGRLSVPPGFYAPNIDPANKITTPRVCPASPECQVSRLLGKDCEPQGPLEPSICKIGHYCPDFTQQIPCPSGYYCALGATEPVKCDPLSLCPEKTYKPRVLYGIAACAVIDILILLFYAIRFFWLAKQQGVSPQQALNGLLRIKRKEPVEDQPKKETKVQLEEFDVNSLPGYFAKALDGRDLKMDFDFQEMGMTLSNGKTILKGITGKIESSKMTAIMGPSGAGKTTFMNVLCGKVNRTSGTLFVSGKEAEVHDFKKLIGYVPQEDIMIRELTVKQVIMHSARVRLPSSWTTKEVEKYVDDLLTALNLYHVKDSPIGDEIKRGVSGGQRKRVNIALELAAVPICMFLDEPTSGLDSTAALEVCKILKSISQLGMTIVSVIHQPRVEIFKMFDNVLMIAPGGRTAYLGPSIGAQPYFENLGYEFPPDANPADVLMDILSGKGINKELYSPDDLVRLWEKQSPASLETKETDFYEVVPKLTKERGASFLRQMYLCHNRSIIQQIRTGDSFGLEAFVSALAGAVTGIAIQGQSTLYTGINIAPLTAVSSATLEWLLPELAFILSLAAGLAASPAAVKVFSEEKSVFWREASAGHNRFAYYMGKTLATIYRLVICSLHFAAALHFIGRPLIPFKILWPVILAVYFGVYGLSAFISMIVARENAALLAVVISLFYSTTAGFGISIAQAKEWGIGFLFQTAFNFYASEALYSEGVKPYSNIYMIDFSASLWGFSLNRVGFDIGMALVCGLGWRVIAFIFMIILNRDKQR